VSAGRGRPNKPGGSSFRMRHHIRQARPTDEPDLAVLFRRSALSNEGDRPLMLDHPEVLRFTLPEDDRAIVRVVADDDDKALGFATLIEEDGFLELEDLFVDPDSMRSGLGTALMGDACHLARVRGAARIEVTANPHARAFYESMGFVTVGVVSTTFGPADRMHLKIG
jgi:GNAT superfamily N-acetyltransferase